MLSVTDIIEVERDGSVSTVFNEDTYYDITSTWTSIRDGNIIIEISDRLGESLYKKKFDFSAKIFFKDVVGCNIVIILARTYNVREGYHVIIYNIETREKRVEIIKTSYEIGILAHSGILYYCEYYHDTILSWDVNESVTCSKIVCNKLVLNKASINDGKYTYLYIYSFLCYINGSVKIRSRYDNPFANSPNVKVYELDGRESMLSLLGAKTQHEKFKGDYHFCDNGYYYFVDVSGIILKYKPGNPVPERPLISGNEQEPSEFIRIMNVFENDLRTVIWVETIDKDHGRVYKKIASQRSRAKGAHNVLR